MKLAGYALSELLVALAVTGLIVSLLTFLNVDYLGLARRVAAIGQPFALGTRAETGLYADRCETPGALLAAGDNAVVAEGPGTLPTPVLMLTSADRRNGLSTGHGEAGSSFRPIRLVVESVAATGRSTAAIEVGDTTVGLVSPRCDLREVCEFDAANAMCREDEGNSVAEPG